MLQKILIPVFLALNCGSVPVTHYYVLDYSLGRGTSNPNARHITLGVLPFTADHEYDQNKIIYRPSDNEISFYNYHKWQDLPSRMVTEKVIEQLSASGYFKYVVGYPSEIAPDLIIRGRVKRFEEWDMPDGWVTKVHMDVKLHDPKNAEEIVWEGTGAAEIRLSEKTVAEVVKGINEALAESIDQIAEALNDHFGQKQ